MPGSHFDEVREFSIQNGGLSSEYQDTQIECIDCSEEFTWTVGEQQFFYDKKLLNPPKRCKECKKAKNRRLEAIELSKITGKRHRIEVKAQCAMCSAVTTVPFYPSQGRPVYCRDCFQQSNVNRVGGAAVKS